MTRVRTLFALGLLTALALAVGCGKKAEPTPGPEGDPKPKPDPAAEAEKAAKADAVFRLQEISFAIHNYEGSRGRLPSGIVGPRRELGLSWRVQILPYLGKDEAKLYEQFNLKEAWDSETNKKLIPKMPAVFASPGKAAPEGKTYLRSFAGENSFIYTPARKLALDGKTMDPPFVHRQPGSFADLYTRLSIMDVAAYTLMVAEAPEPVEWTKPEDLPYEGPRASLDPLDLDGRKQRDRTIPPPPKLGGVFTGGFHGLMCNGAVHFFPDTLDPKTISALISIHGAETRPKEVTEILSPPQRQKPAPPDEISDSLPDAAARKTAVANYQKILKGMQDHEAEWGYFPVGISGPQMSVGLSWRVQILPYIGEEKLYKEFKLAEAWDGEHNKKLIEKMPAVFASPGKAADKGHTFVRTTQGPGGIIKMVPGMKGEMVVAGTPAPPTTPVRGRRITSFTDGTMYTILFFEAGEAVPWTKPDELYMSVLDYRSGGKGQPPTGGQLPPLGGVFADGFHTITVYGNVTFYKTGYPPFDLAKMFVPDDGWGVEPLGEPDKILYSISPR